MHLSDFIQGNRFAELGEFSVLDGMEPQAIPPNRGIKVLFCKQDRVDRFFSYIELYGRPVILISHNADTNVGERHLAALPHNVVRWFAQNVLVTDDRLTPIPIGLERPNVGGSSDYAAILDARQRRKQITPKKKFLLSINPNTNPSLRMSLLERLRKFPNVTIVSGLNFKTYLDAIVDHEFVISPPGNGYDCHRTWEALYVGAIPIVWGRSFFAEIPMIRVVDTESLIDFVKRGTVGVSLYDNIPQLSFSYWKNLILSTRDNLC